MRRKKLTITLTIEGDNDQALENGLAAYRRTGDACGKDPSERWNYRVEKQTETKRVLIESPEHFNAARAFAKQLGGKARRSFIRSIHTLNCLKRNAPADMTLFIYQDWVKHSFAWVIHNPDTNKRYYNGGMILHGFEETLSVELIPNSGPHWSIHT